MTWQSVQVGNLKAKKRTPWLKDLSPRDEVNVERALGMHRDTTKLCSAAIHGCGHMRDLCGPTRQELKAALDDEEFST